MTDSVDLAVSQRLAARVASFADVRDVRLFESESRFEGFPDLSNALGWQLEVTPSVKYEPGDDFFIVEIVFQVAVSEASEDEIEDESQEAQAEVASVRCKYGALYSLEVPEGRQRPTTEELDAYSKTTGVMLLYPYAREFVQSTTSRMGLPPLTISAYTLPYPDISTAPAEPDSRS